jgi:hypothetical protein
MVAEHERFLLKIYDVNLPSNNTMSLPPGKEDKCAVSILHMCQPTMLQNYTPRKVVGDGNCAFRAVSLALFGTEDLHCLLRLLTALELLSNQLYYDPPATTFMRVLKLDENDTYSELVSMACTNGACINMAILYALSASIRLPLKTYYPPINENDCHAKNYTRTIFGRNVAITNDYSVTLMWSQTKKLNCLLNFNPNHFVLLVEKSFQAVPETTVSSDICDNQLPAMPIDILDIPTAKNPFTSLSKVNVKILCIKL